MNALFRIALGVGCLIAAGLVGAPSARAAEASSATSTPRGALSAAPAALAPRFVPPSRVFTQRLAITLEAPRPDAEVRFTLDGQEPTAASPRAQEPIRLLRTTLVRARAFQNGRPLGPSVAHSYLHVSPEVAQFAGNLPLVLVALHGQEVQHESKRPASLHFIDVTNGVASAYGPSLGLRGEVWWRGKSSLRYVKRSLGLKTRDDSGQSRSVSLLGFPADSDWVLYAPYPDKSLIRDVLAYDLSRQMGHYASRTRFVEVFLHESNARLTMEHYQGVYVLEEKIKRGSARVNLQKLGTNDNAEPMITGGYIIKKDHADTRGEVEPTIEGRPWGGGGGGGGPMSGPRYGYPTGPGGFPGDPRGFLPTVGGEGAREMSGRNRGRDVFNGPGNRRGFERGDRDVIFENGQPVIIERPMPRERGGFDRRRGGIPGLPFPGASPMVEESFATSLGTEFFYVEPKEDEITAAQRQWLRSYLNEFERVLSGPTFADPRRGYAAYIEADSFIDYHLMVEVTKNIDGFRFSTYYQKDRGGRLRAEPVWDWNLSFGNANGKQGWMAEYWYWPQLDDEQYSYYRRLFEDPDFGQRYVDRWGELRATVFSTSNLMARIDAHVASLGDARIRNFARWPILGVSIWPNYFVGDTYEDEIRYLKDWTRKRLAWIDTQFVAAPQWKQPASPGRPATLSAPRGQIFYTTDGTDPRAPGGRPSSRAVAHANGGAIGSGATVITARAAVDGRWSPPLRVRP